MEGGSRTGVTGQAGAGSARGEDGARRFGGVAFDGVTARTGSTSVTVCWPARSRHPLLPDDDNRQVPVVILSRLPRLSCQQPRLALVLHPSSFVHLVDMHGMTWKM